jgi:prophage regulatory protein
MAQQDRPVPPRLCILRRREVEARTGLSRSTIYLRCSQNSFPSPIRLGGRAVGWLESEIDTWLRVQVATSRASSK